MITYIAAKKISDFMGHNHIEIQGLSDQDFNMTIKSAKGDIVIIPWNKGLTGNIPWNKGLTGNKLSDETKEKLRKANTGKTLSKEHKEKISQSNKCKKQTEKQIKALISRSSKPVNKFDDMGKFITTFSSLKECSLQNQLYIKTLKKHIVSKTPLGGFLYKFNEDIV
jgi:hypothetical protein